MVISSGTPEGSPNVCPICGSNIKIEPSDPAGDAPCPRCGHLLWYIREELGETLAIGATRVAFRPDDLDRLIEAAPKPGVRLVLDFSEVRCLSAAFLSKLIQLKKRLAGVEGKLEIENLHPDLLHVFRISRLDQVFDMDR